MTDTSTVPRIIHNGDVVGYGWRLNDAMHPELDYEIVDLSFHPDDWPMVVAHYDAQIDRIQDSFLASVVENNRGRITVYILKRFELMSLLLNLPELETPILDAESGGDPITRQELVQQWSKKGAAWLSLVGASEQILRKSKIAMAKAANDGEMSQIIVNFKASLERLISGE